YAQMYRENKEKISPKLRKRIYKIMKKYPTIEEFQEYLDRKYKEPKFSFAEYIFKEFKGKSFPDIDGLPVEISNNPKYLKWLKEDGKEVPKELNPFVLVYLEREGEEERMDVVYWIEPIKTEKGDYDIQLPWIIVKKEESDITIELKILELGIYASSQPLKIEHLIYDKFTAELVGKE
ncbi:MAG: hypothetical protein GXN99_02055, partial [Candidatus Nanohaloarchaeota archaeon]|nr:hypothetical protein [Candidatus Nanohaloarchaeota archaeon]